MKDLFFYDPMCSVGDDLFGNRAANTPAELLAEMDRYGIDRALVQYSALDAVGAVFSNDWISRFVAADTSGRLKGVWCLLPPHCGELPEDLFGEMQKNNIAALTLSPFGHNWVPCKITIGKLMAEAAVRQIPILLNHYNARWPELYSFVEMFPENRLLVHDTTRHGPDRRLCPLMENYPNLYYVLSAHWVPEGIRDLAEKYGAERLLYGSAYPLYHQGSMMLALKHSGLSDQEIAMIAGGNLKKLLEEAGEK